MSDPEVSVIIPVYNKQEYLDKCLNSVINQTYFNIEVIIIDDGSTDDSTSICKIYNKKDDRINLIIKENAGVSSARNLGIKVAKDQWVLFLDSDDFLELDAVENLLDIAKRNHSDVVYYGCNIYRDGNIIRTRNVKEYREYNELESFLNNEKLDPASVCLNFMKKQIISDNNLFFNETMKHNEDGLFIYRLYCHVKNVTVYNKAFYNIVLSTNSVSRKSIDIKIIKDNLLFISELCNYVRKYELIKEFKEKINMLLKVFFVNLTYFQESDKYIAELQIDYSNLYKSNKDIFYTNFSKLAYINIEFVSIILNINHRLRRVKYDIW